MPTVLQAEEQSLLQDSASQAMLPREQAGNPTTQTQSHSIPNLRPLLGPHIPRRQRKVEAHM